MLPLFLAMMLGFSCCKKDPSPIVFHVSDLVTGEPVANAEIYWKQTFMPTTTIERVGSTDALGQVSWTKELDSLPNPLTHFFTCNAPGYYEEQFAFTTIDQKSFEVKMRPNARVRFHLKDQDSSSLKSYSISVIYTVPFGLGETYETNIVPIFYVGNKTVMDEWVEAPIPDYLHAKFICSKTNASNPGNPAPAQIFEIAGRPNQPIYNFDVVW